MPRDNDAILSRYPDFEADLFEIGAIYAAADHRALTAYRRLAERMNAADRHLKMETVATEDLAGIPEPYLQDAMGDLRDKVCGFLDRLENRPYSRALEPGETRLSRSIHPTFLAAAE